MSDVQVLLRPFREADLELLYRFATDADFFARACCAKRAFVAAGGATWLFTGDCGTTP